MNLIIICILGILIGYCLAITSKAINDITLFKRMMKESIDETMLEVNCDECKKKLKKIQLKL